MFKTTTRGGAHTPVTVVSFTNENRTHVKVNLAEADSSKPAYCYIAVVDLTDTPPDDLPVDASFTLVFNAPVITAPSCEAMVPEQPAQPVVVTAALKVTEPEPVMLLCSQEQVTPTPMIDAIEVTLPMHPGIPEKLTKAQARKKVYAYVKGQQPAPTKPEDQIPLSQVLALAQQHGDQVVVSDGNPWVTASTFFKQLA